MPEDTNYATDRAKAVATFITELADEGERSAVVLGAARADTAVEELLLRCMQPHPGGADNLFDPDRPLGSFSAKIALSFRLELSTVRASTLSRCCAKSGMTSLTLSHDPACQRLATKAGSWNW
jgi:hypothetical protein